MTDKPARIKIAIQINEDVVTRTDGNYVIPYSYNERLVTT